MNFHTHGFVGLIAHETGHIYGQGHSGLYDSNGTITGHNPVMSTCLGYGSGGAVGSNNRYVLIQDDHASAQDIDSAFQWHNVTANHSFENLTNNFGQNISWWLPASSPDWS